MKTVRNEKELASSLKNGNDTIIIEGDLCNRVIRIKATGTAAVGILGTGTAVSAVLIAALAGGWHFEFSARRVVLKK